MTEATVTPIEKVLSRLSGVRESAGQWVAYCPCRNDDRSQSLSVAEGKDGRVLMRCHRGSPCAVPDICAAMELDVKELYPYTPPVKETTFVDGKLTNTYSYYDESGELVFQVLRFMMPDGRKEFRQRVPDATSESGWKYSTRHLGNKPLYKLPEVLKAVEDGRVIYVAEGEKDVEALWEAGVAATCNPQGADSGHGNKWCENHTRSLAGASRVVIIADNDEPGMVHAEYVAKQLSRNGSTVKIKRAPSPHKDAHDMISHGVQLVDLVEVRTYEPDPFWSISERVSELAETDLSPEQKAAKATALLRSLVQTDEAKTTGRLVTWPDFISEVTSDTYDWVIEGMLERQERLMVVAAEGVGKTTLARQVAILSGAGIHPFNYTEIPPVRTLFVDLENPEKIIRRQSRRILESIQANYPKRKITAALYTKPDGMNILTDKDKSLLEEQIRRTEPELLVIGPIYKSFIDPGGKTSTALVTEVVMYFDYLRATYNIALWMEHHAPLGNALTGRDLRPSDSAVWMRWPEFGFAIAPDPTSHVREYDFKQWRGPRDVRQWPAKMIRGTMFPFQVTEWAST